MEKPQIPESELKSQPDKHKSGALRKALAAIVGLGVLGSGATRSEPTPERPTDVTAPAKASSEVNIGTAESMSRYPENSSQQEIAALDMIDAAKPFEFLTGVDLNVQIQTSATAFDSIILHDPVAIRDNHGQVARLMFAVNDNPLDKEQKPTEQRLVFVTISNNPAEGAGVKGTFQYGNQERESSITVAPYENVDQPVAEALAKPTTEAIIGQTADGKFVGPNGVSITASASGVAGDAAPPITNPEYPA